METPYSEIYNSFLEKITDYNLPSFTNEDRENILHGLMIRASSKFKRLCKVDLSDKDDIIAQFNNTLDDEIIDIISTGMIVEWLKPKYYLDDHMQNMLNTNDYKLAASPANMLSSIRETYNQTKQEFKSAMNEYSFVHSEIGNSNP